MARAEGMNYMPTGKPNPIVKPGEFVYAAVALDHAHIGGMCNGLNGFMIRTRPRWNGI